MKCPYCRIHYDDSESVCPVCGKRAGTFPPIRKPRTTARGSKPQRVTPAPEAASVPKTPQATVLVQKHTNTKKLASPVSAKKKNNTLSRLILGIVVVLFVFQILFPMLMGLLSNFSFSTSEPDFPEQEAIDMATFPDWIVGTWVNDNGEKFTIDPDGLPQYNTGQKLVDCGTPLSLFALTWETASPQDLEGILPDQLLTLDFSQYTVYEMDTDLFFMLYENDVISYPIYLVVANNSVITQFLLLNPLTEELVFFEKQTQNA